MKPKVYITRKIPDEMIAMIEKECDIRMGNDWDNPVADERGFRGKGL